MARAVLVLAAYASVSITVAAARPFPLPPAAPIATIDVPEDWRPSATGDGVEGSAVDGAVRLAVEFIPGADRDSAIAAAMASLRRQGVSPDPETRRSSARRYNGFDALKVDFSGRDPNGESRITLILVAMPARTGFVAVGYWGDDEAQETVGNDLQRIADSIKPSN